MDSHGYRRVQASVWICAKLCEYTWVRGRREDTYFLRPLDVVRMLPTLQMTDKAVSLFLFIGLLGQNSSVVSCRQRQSLELYIGVDMCIQVDMDMCIDMCIGMRTGMCLCVPIDLFMGVCVDNCIDRFLTGMRTDSAHV